jgi:adenine deaminase
MHTATPDLVITGARMLSTYSERTLSEKEIWLKGGRIACVQPLDTALGLKMATRYYDAKGGIIAPGLVDPHILIESSMMTAYAEAALLNGTTTIFCDSHEIGNVSGVEGIEWMLEDARCAPLNIFLTLPSTMPATSSHFETAGGDLTPERIAGIFDKWPEAVALGEKMDFVQVCTSDQRSHAIIAESPKHRLPPVLIQCRMHRRITCETVTHHGIRLDDAPTRICENLHHGRFATPDTSCKSYFQNFIDRSA